jgi:hypothetical protein
MKQSIGWQLIFSVFILTLFMACEDPPGPYINDDFIVDVVYSDDWKFITIYLDDVSAPIGVTYNQTAAGAMTPGFAGAMTPGFARAMTPDTARVGFDFFEVFFYYKGTVARAQWELGKRASIMDVYRTFTGIDYSAASRVKNPDACALLFAGRKGDKTLLALGKIISVDDEPTGVVRERSEYVTFELSALTAAVSTETNKSSFLTSSRDDASVASDNTKVINALLGERYFPLYVLDGKTTLNAEYYFDLDGDWRDYENSIIIVEEGVVDKRQARYPAGGGMYFYAKYGEDLTTVVQMTNNQLSTEGLQNPVTFAIDTNKTNTVNPEDNGIFTIAFKIPVCGISSISSLNLDDCWYVRPAYTSYYYNIDNGITDGRFTDRNICGAVLCGVDVPLGDFDIPVVRR